MHGKATTAQISNQSLLSLHSLMQMNLIIRNRGWESGGGQAQHTVLRRVFPILLGLTRLDKKSLKSCYRNKSIEANTVEPIKSDLY